MIILGIETSCDDTSTAIITDKGNILSQITVNQNKKHDKYGGVVPEIAARAHNDVLPHIVKQVVKQSNIDLRKIDAIAATGGPGLMGGLIVGISYAKTLAMALDTKFIAVNHLEGHILSPRIENKCSFPYLSLLISGGHCQMTLVKGIGEYQLIGETLDDAPGEVFDKIGRELGLPYPGGVHIEQKAKQGNKSAFNFPRPMSKHSGFNFSFSGLKTAVKKTINKLPMNEIIISDISASFQEAIKDTILHKMSAAIRDFAVKRITICGGVAANKSISRAIENMCRVNNLDFIVPSLSLCKDNAAMIGWVGIERMKGEVKDNHLDFDPMPKWPIQNLH